MDDKSSYLVDMQVYIEFVINKNKDFGQKTGKKPMVYSKTYGCKQNVSDSEKLDGIFKEMGYGFTDEIENASLIIYNTCAVRENAESKIFGNIGELKSLKTTNENLIICICGCMVQQEHIVEKIKKSYPFVDIIFGPSAICDLPKLISEKMNGKNKIVDLLISDNYIVEGMPVLRDNNLKAWLPIMYGCNNFCTYCVVPLVRGRERSREPEAIIAEAKQLIKEGFKEITLLGQNVNSYGQTLKNRTSFSNLLQQINNLDGEFIIRFMTSHPKDCTKELIDTMAISDKVSKHIHLPVQSGCNKILLAMNRHYKREDYIELVKYAREKIPDITFTSDIIVGFPGETESDFNDTIELVKKIEYSALFTFIYSKREGTSAAKMEDLVSHEEKMQRFQNLLAIQSEIGSKINRVFVGKTLRVLVEKKSVTENNLLTGRADSNVIVNFEGNENSIGKFVNVLITDSAKWSLIGKMV